MKSFVWEDIYSVNVKEIDEQHKKLIRMIDDLQKSLDVTCKPSTQTTIHNLLLRLIDYSIVHFNTEEKYFSEFNYHDTIKHRKEHVEFSKKVLEFNKQFDTDDSVLNYDMIIYLVDWLKDHILNSDKAYTACFNKHGLH